MEYIEKLEELRGHLTRTKIARNLRYEVEGLSFVSRKRVEIDDTFTIGCILELHSLLKDKHAIETKSNPKNGVSYVVTDYALKKGGAEIVFNVFSGNSRQHYFIDIDNNNKIVLDEVNVYVGSSMNDFFYV